MKLGAVPVYEVQPQYGGYIDYVIQSRPLRTGLYPRNLIPLRYSNKNETNSDNYLSQIAINQAIRACMKVMSLLFTGVDVMSDKFASLRPLT